MNCKTPILFLIFNRLDTSIDVFNSIRKAKPLKLYIASDGPRVNNLIDLELINKVRTYVLNNIDWDCEVFTLFRDGNLGCKIAVSTAITWFFECEEEGIILEDDCLPEDSFFNYCSVLLEKYRFDERVRHISGTNINNNIKIGDGSYFFSNFTHIWGWATWKRVWKDYNSDIPLLEKFLEQNLDKELYNNQLINSKLVNNFSSVYQKKIDTWDYQYLFLNYYNNGLCIFPNKNLIKNIGFGENATHTKDVNSKYSNLKTFEINEIIHPTFFVPIKSIDVNFFLDEINQPVTLRTLIMFIYRNLLDFIKYFKIIK